MTNALYVLYAILIFGVIVFFHELGHFLAARACGIAVDEFSIGFGPSLIGKKGKNTLYSLRLLPLGGFCRFVGEDGESERDDAFGNQSVFKRIIVTFSGPFMNFVLAYITTVFFLMVIGVSFIAPMIGSTDPGLNARRAGMLSGDIITKINDAEISFDEAGVNLATQIISSAEADVPLSFTVKRGEETLVMDIAPAMVDGVKRIGITMGYGYRFPLGQALVQGFDTVKNVFVIMIDSLKTMFTTGEGIEDTTGPVGAISVMSTEMRRGFDMTLYMIILISLNLGIINLLPIPGLDGGRLLFQVIEAVRRKPIKPEHEGWIHAAGIMALFGLMIVLTYRDIARLITGA